MDIIIWLLAAFSLSWFISFKRMSLSSLTFAFIALMAVGTFFNVIGFVSWLLFAVFALPVNIESFRKQFISMPFLSLYRKIMPQMSETEQQAIGAGTTWFDAELFRGNHDWKKLHNYAQPR